MEFENRSIESKKRIIQIAIDKLISDRAERTPAVNDEYGNGEFVDELYANSIAELQKQLDEVEHEK